MKKFVVLEKKVGETPLEAVREWKKVNPEYTSLPASYAGRLDPMASGKLLVLLGEECKRQAAYMGLDKEYEVEVLCGVGSDTGDILGLTRSAGSIFPFDRSRIASALKSEVGAHTRAYPIFSSKTVSGKPLFLYALEGTLHTIQIPEHVERIYALRQLGTYMLSRESLKKQIAELLLRVPHSDEPSKLLGADFRVDAVRNQWEKFFRESKQSEYAVLRLRVRCASGTYMRSLAPRIGLALGTNALALSIHRTKIGQYVPLVGGFGIWASQF